MQLTANNAGGAFAMKKFSACAFAGALLLLAFFARPVQGSEIIPPRPDAFFNDYAHVVNSETASALNEKLKEFERQTSSQVLVAVFPKMQSDSSIEDYTVRVAQAWGAGQQGKNNGAVLFVFIQDRKMYLQVGYGLEGAIPDALAKRIIENELKPRFRNGDYTGGLTAGVNAVIAAAKGEYKGTGQTVYERKQQQRASVVSVIVLFLIVGLVGFIGLASLLGALSGGGYRRRGYWGSGGWVIGSGGWSGGSSGGGGGGWSGGGGFSSGGGSFGGGGAGGSW